MTDCERADIRDLLPDLLVGRLASAEAERVEAHVRECAECSAELAMLRTARAMRPVVPTLDVARIVSQLPRPVASHEAADPSKSASTDRSVISLDAHREKTGRRWPARSVWRAAATIGVMIVGGWSVLIVRSGGIGMVTTGQADSARLSDTPSAVTVPSVGSARTAPSTPTTTPAASAAADPRVSVSFGSLSDYSDEELQSVLDRLDKWDGATSTETVTTTPILPVKGDGGTN